MAYQVVCFGELIVQAIRFPEKCGEPGPDLPRAILIRLLERLFQSEQRLGDIALLQIGIARYPRIRAFSNESGEPSRACRQMSIPASHSPCSV